MAGQEKFDDQFEREWRSAFQDMQETPPTTLWNEIDRQLAYDELAVYKNRAAYYKWSAAAVVFLAVFSGLMLYLSDNFSDSNDQLAQAINVDKPTDQKYSIRIDMATVTSEERNDRVFGRSTMPLVVTEENENREQESRVFSEPGGSDKGENNEPPINEGQFYELVLEKLNPETMIAANYEDKEVFKVATYDFQVQSGKVKEDEKFYAGVGMGHGSFDPNFRAGESALSVANSAKSVPTAFSLANDEALDRKGPDVREGMNSGQTVALGLNFGVKVGDRWSLESGFQYTRSDATTTTNVVIETTTIREVIPASSEVKNVPRVQRAMQQEAVIEYDYQDVDMANEFQFATIPVKAGYILLDSKFTIEINAGVAANVYLGNKLTASNEQLASVTFGPGNTSPYRELSFSGLAGLQLGYEFFKSFDLVVEPNYRRSINSLTKDNSSFTASPSGFGVMTGIRYRFN